ncbi:putative C2 domain-containing protein [Dioscorea sansibarensis]
MAFASIEITLISARDLKDVNFFSRLEVYAIAWLSSDPRTRHRTAPDREGRRNPNWNTTFRFALPSLPSATSATLHVLLRTRRSLGDRDVGEVHVPLSELLSSPSGDSSSSLSYQVRRPSSRRPKGVLHLSYKLSDPIPSPIPNPNPNSKSNENGTVYPTPPAVKPEEPVTAYPASTYPPPSYGGYPAYPAPPYGYPPQSGAPGYGYPQAGYGYGAPPPAAPAPAAGRGMGGGGLGLGLGAGLIGGTLGGLLMGDLISDSAAYEAGYDAGFGDGFDF